MEVIRQIKKITITDKTVEKVEKIADRSYIQTLKLTPLDLEENKFNQYEAICHTWFIAKDVGMEINWKNPLVQKSQISTCVEINEEPFAEGAMRYAFYGVDVVCD